MPETIPYVYTTREELESIFGVMAITLRADDDDTGAVSAAEEAWIDDAIAEATDQINIYCNTRYAASDLANSLWVRRACSYFAIHILSQRRGNAEQYEPRIRHYTEQLERIRQGLLYIPRIPYRNNQDPSLVNTVIDDRYPRSKQRVQLDQSVGETDSYINADHPLYIDGY